MLIHNISQKQKIRIYQYLAFAIALITVSSVNVSSTLQVGNTFMWWTVYFFTIIILIKARKFFYNPASVDKRIAVLRIYFLWNIICIIRGIGVADNYWEWKNLIGTSAVLMFPLTVNISTNTDLLRKIISFWVRYILPGFFLFLPFIYSGDGGMGYYLAPLTMLLLFLPILRRKWKYILLLYAMFVIFGNLDSRSNVLKFSVAILCSLFYYVQKWVKLGLLKFLRIVLMIAPLAFFLLAVTGLFNVFDVDEYYGERYATERIGNQTVQVSLTADTRTLLYNEVIGSALKYDYWLFGRTPARGNESETFGMFALEELNTGKMERFINEVSILNIFTWTGLIGVLLYFWIFFQASYLAVFKSNNIHLKIIGIYIAFRWCYAWVQDFNNFDLSNFFLWFMIGMCFSKVFRDMSDKEMKDWVLQIFNFRRA